LPNPSRPKSPDTVAPLRQNAVDRVAVDVGETAVDAVVAPGQIRVVDAEEFHHRGMHVVHRGRLVAIERLVAPLVALTVRDAPPDPTATQPVGEHKWVVVSALAPCELGIRPNSVVQSTSVSSNRPRCSRSWMRAAAPRAMPVASGP